MHRTNGTRMNFDTTQAAGMHSESGTPFRVLVAEDDPSLRLLWSMTIETWELPLHVSIAEDGHRALMQISDDTPDLIITDLEMPNVGGRQLIDRISATTIPVIVVSCMLADDLLDLPNVVGSFPKPMPFKKIRQLVEKLMHERGGDAGPAPTGPAPR